MEVGVEDYCLYGEKPKILLFDKECWTKTSFIKACVYW